MEEEEYLMKRMMVIAIMVCLLLLAATGAAAAAGPKLPPSQRVAQFNVTFDNDVVGKLSVNTNAWTYVMNAHGLEPGKMYYFYRLGGFPAIGSGTADPDGNLHLRGSWDPQLVDPLIRSGTAFILSDGPLTGSCLSTRMTSGTFKGILRTTVFGTLSTAGGVPLPGQSITIIWHKRTTDTWYWYADTSTRSDGTFRVTVADPTPMRDNPVAEYYGGSYNGIPYCPSSVVSSWSDSIPL